MTEILGYDRVSGGDQGFHRCAVWQEHGPAWPQRYIWFAMFTPRGFGGDG